MKFGLIIIGDEILSGKRADKHMAKVVELLKARGLKLSWVEYLGDDPAWIRDTFKRTFDLAASGEWCIFSCGGIGATPDDHTRDAAGAALGVEMRLHPEAEEQIKIRSAEMKQEVTPARLLMGTFPAGAIIIPNPYNRIAGFAIRHHWFVPGFPVMAWPMIEWVLDTRYQQHFDHEPYLEKSIYVFDLGEGRLIEVMREVEKNPALKSFSLPSVGKDAATPGHVELGAKGEPHAVEAALETYKTEVEKLGGRWSMTL
jgi:molybdopterin-biosynthesis enzyme MoeA-like protein